ncbi:GNAT family N-acetyltransferase [Tissierella sp. MB52-C2]|uniref:GNAT family N-acetyltransferase n=1 Tax=Tissierella sp. MB52-C2 TaxID=3070999 RepID=UPI00280B3AC6|nr:GNAT family N-acetyltransferase [Tissierella sp. MB52-C2]WMM25224.1 GNAT family N-acetyltransferase [Tissierella sp. MB52-C2]
MLETERLVLRDISNEDAEDIVRIWSDPRVNKYLQDPLYSNVEVIKGMIPVINSSLNYAFVIIQKDTETIIGTCGIGPQVSLEDEWEFGYCLGPEAWGNGYATEILCALIRLAQKNGIKAVVGEVAIDNLQSVKVMEKNGLQFYKDSVFTKADGSATFKSKIYRRIL